MSWRLFVFALFGLPLACQPKDDATGDSGGGDSGTGDSGAGDSGDSGGGDSGGGETGDSGDPTLVQMTVYDPTTGEPDANEAVLFFAPDGTFLVEATTDTDGRASAEVDAGGTVVVMVRQSTEEAFPYTPVVYFDVAPGDRLTYRSVPPLSSDRAGLTVSAVEGASTYWHSTGCGDDLWGWGIAYSTTTTSALTRCADADVLVQARSADGMLGLQVATGVDTTADAVTLTDPWLSTTTVELAATGLDPATETASVDAWHSLGSARVPGSAYGDGPPSAQRFQATGQMVVADGLTYTVWVGQQREGYLTSTAVLRRPASADLAVDVSAVALPWITVPAFDPATRTVSWTTAGTGTIDTVVGWAMLGRGDSWIGWQIGAAPEGASVTLPLLPAPWADYNPVATDSTAGEYYFLRGEGLADDAATDPAALLDRLYDLRGAEPTVDYAGAFTRTFLP